MELVCLQALVPRLVCGCDPGPAPPAAHLSHLVPQRVSFTGYGFRGGEGPSCLYIHLSSFFSLPILLGHRCSGLPGMLIDSYM